MAVALGEGRDSGGGGCGVEGAAEGVEAREDGGEVGLVQDGGVVFVGVEVAVAAVFFFPLALFMGAFVVGLFPVCRAGRVCAVVVVSPEIALARGVNFAVLLYVFSLFRLFLSVLVILKFLGQLWTDRNLGGDEEVRDSVCLRPRYAPSAIGTLTFYTHKFSTGQNFEQR